VVSCLTAMKVGGHLVSFLEAHRESFLAEVDSCVLPQTREQTRGVQRRRDDTRVCVVPWHTILGARSRRKQPWLSCTVGH